MVGCLAGQGVKADTQAVHFDVNSSLLSVPLKAAFNGLRLSAWLAVTAMWVGTQPYHLPPGCHKCLKGCLCFGGVWLPVTLPVLPSIASLSRCRSQPSLPNDNFRVLTTPPHYCAQAPRTAELLTQHSVVTCLKYSSTPPHAQHAKQ